ncbi:hypothetical protein OROMI_004536 [Orobanche minor]
MVSIELKALPLRKHNLSHNLSQDSLMTGKSESSYDGVGRKRNMGWKGSKKHAGYHGDASAKNQSGASQKTESVPQASFVRKQVDAVTVKYFSEIANVIEGTEMDLEERYVICGNALEEAKGKEAELATDYIISHTMQTLLDGCSVDHLCSFLQSCAKNFSHISMDRSGSHVAETALKSLARHLEDEGNHSLIEETISELCQRPKLRCFDGYTTLEIVANPVDIMCNCYGSHVLRRLLCLCKGAPADSLEFHSTKPSIVLAERLNMRSSKLDSHELHQSQPFPDQLKFLMSELLNPSRTDIAVLQKNQYSSLVLQTALKLLAGEEEELSLLIPVLLGCRTDNVSDGDFIELPPVKKILRLVEDNAYSHLMEVILAVAPDTIYSEIFTKVFKDSLFKLSSQPSGNFVVQALISHARSQEHCSFNIIHQNKTTQFHTRISQSVLPSTFEQMFIKLIFEELGSKFRKLLELGRSGVVAALIAASERLKILEHKCCQALADAVCLTNESSTCIVPRILFLDSYIYTDDKANWNWPSGVKMHVLGSLILQSVFRFPRESIQPYITSITSLEDKFVLEASKDPAGARVIEAFLVSNASPKHKQKLSVKLRGHFGELSVLPSGSFTVEKCFSASNMSLRETIVSELLPFQTELSKTKQGPYLLKKLDVAGCRIPSDDGVRGLMEETCRHLLYSTILDIFKFFGLFAERPEQWRSRLNSKQSAYKEFYETFGPKDTDSSRSEKFLSDTRQNPQVEKLKGMRKEIDTRLSSAFSCSPGSSFLAHQGSTKPKKSGKNKQVPDGKGFQKNVDGIFSRSDRPNNEKSSTTNTEKKRRRKDGLPTSLNKKLKADITD